MNKGLSLVYNLSKAENLPMRKQDLFTPLLDVAEDREKFLN